jgi:arabinofuranan 3-O-arabinosyltransferase
LLSAPGKVSADTKTYLYLDPGRLLSRAPTMWDPNVGFGTVTHQTIGYLFPMGPYYGLMARLGVPDWIAQRLWLGSLVLVAALGVLYLARQLGRSGAGVVVAALAYAFSPYSLHYSARLSVLLMPWAVLGFLIGLVVRSVREGGWRAPALFALTVQIVGGVNATSLVFAGIAPVLWLLWTWLGARETTLRRCVGVVMRIGVTSIATSLWWIAGLAVQGSYGINILRYTETVSVVARTSTPNEVLRGLGYWFFYGRDRLGPWIEGSTSYTQSIPLILLTYGLAALALLAAVTVQWRQRGYFVWLLLVGTIVAVGAHPYASPTPLGAVFKAFATTSTAGLALRSTPRAVPLVTMATAMLLGSGVDAGVAWLRGRERGRVAIAAPIVVGALVLAAFPPLWNGSFYGDNLLRDEQIPDYWQATADDVDAGDPATRVLEIPGSDFAAYHWGDTVDPITPGLIDRPYVARELIPYGSAASADLLNALDRQIQEGTADPAGFADLLRRMGVGTVIVRNDLEWQRYNLVRPRELAAFLDRAPGLVHRRVHGPMLDRAVEYPDFGSANVTDERTLIGPTGPMPHAVLVFDVDDPTPIVRSYSADSTLMVSGDGEGVVDASEAGELDADAALVYSASLDDAELAAMLDDDPDAVLVVTDSNRRRGRRWSTLRDNLGETEVAGQRSLDDDLTDARLPAFGDPDADPAVDDAGDDARSVIEYLDTGGPRVAMIRATGTGNPIAYTPEDRPARAFDGDVHTSWKTSAFDQAVGDQIEITLEVPITTDRVRLVQVRNGPVDRYVTKARLRFDDERSVDVELDDASRSADGQVVAFGQQTFARFTIEIVATNVSDGPLYSGQSAVGFAEIELTDGADVVRAHEVVRLPRDLTAAAAASNSDAHPIEYVFSRLRGVPVPPRYDEELSLDRRFDVPRDARFELSGEARYNPNPYDPRQLSVALGLIRFGAFESVASSGVMPGCTTCLAEGAFDGENLTVWQPPIGQVRGSWLELAATETQTIDHLDLKVLADGRHSLPTSLRVSVDDRSVDVDVPPIRESTDENASTEVRVDFDAMTGQRIRLTVLDIDPRQGSSYYDSNPRNLPVGIVESGIRAVRQVEPFGGDPGRLRCRENLMLLDGDALPIRLIKPSGPFLGLGSMKIENCDGSPIVLTAGTHTITTARGVDTAIDIDRLVLSSTLHRTDSSARPAVRVIDDGRTKLRVALDPGAAGAWLVLGQSFNEGWTARVADGESLGDPMLIDGFANGWRVPPTERRGEIEVVLEWTPQRGVNRALAVSVLAVIGALGVVLVSRRRLGRPVVPPTETVEFARSAPAATSPRAAVVAAVAIAVGSSVIVRPVVGLALGAFAGAALIRPRLRTALAWIAPLTLAGVGAFIALQQLRYEYDPIFEWPTLFPRVRTWGWIAAVIPTIVWIVDRVLDRGRASPAEPGDE